MSNKLYFGAILFISLFLTNCATRNVPVNPTPTEVLPNSDLLGNLTLYASFDKGFDAGFAKGDGTIFTAPAYDQIPKSTSGMTVASIKRVAGEGVGGGTAVHFTEKTQPVIFYSSLLNMSYDKQNWNGTISLWLKVNPEEDLAPGYTDPIQITDSGYDDAGLWVDFSNKNPRSFRMGLYGDREVWNPKKIGPDENPAFQNRLLAAKDRPFSRENWTHVVVSFSKLNTENGRADFYINGLHQGHRDISEPFTWEYEKSKIFLGLNYVGMLDEVALFDRNFNTAEVLQLYELEGGLKVLIE